MRPPAPLLSAAARAAAPAAMLSSPTPTTAGSPQTVHKVGVIDFELDYEPIDGSGAAASSTTTSWPSSSSPSPSPPPLDHSRHLVGSFYYPAAAPSTQRAHRWSPTFYHTRSYVSFASRMSPDHGTALRKAKTLAMAAVSHGVLLAAGIRVSADAGRAAPPLKETGTPFGAVVFSHGLGGSRAAYSAFAAALASAGFGVLAIEHADGTAAVAKLAGTRGFKDYERWQPGGEQLQARGEARRAELAAAARVWRALLLAPSKEGDAEKEREALLGGGRLSLEGGTLPLDFFVGAVDPGSAPAVVGHSFGGALAADAAAGGGANAADADDGKEEKEKDEENDLLFSAAVCLDPWWGALPPGSPAATSSDDRTPSTRRAPLLVLGSDAWNTPNAEGELFCGREQQERVLSSFAQKSSISSSTSSSKNNDNGNNGGALFAVLKGSSHQGFSDVVSLVPALSKLFYGRRRAAAAATRVAEAAAAAAGGKVQEVEEEEEEEESTTTAVTEATDPISTAKAAAEMSAAFLMRRRHEGGSGRVTAEDAAAVVAAARGVGVELRELRVV